MASRLVAILPRPAFGLAIRTALRIFKFDSAPAIYSRCRARPEDDRGDAHWPAFVRNVPCLPRAGPLCMRAPAGCCTESRLLLRGDDRSCVLPGRESG